MTRDYMAEARALVSSVLDHSGVLGKAEPRTFEAIVVAVARDLEFKDLVDASAHRGRRDTDSL